MNAVATAIERTVQLRPAPAEFEDTFNRELEAVEMDPNADSVVLAVPRQAALLWARDEMNDLQLMASMNGEFGAIWAWLLPNRRSLRLGIESAREYHRNGAELFVTYAKNPIVERHWLKRGCWVTKVHDDGTKKLIGGKEFVQRYFRLI